jgi:NAD+ kinase
VAARIAILVHPTRDVRRAIAALIEWSADHGVEVVQLGGPEHVTPGTVDGATLVLAVGGDGTVLAALRSAAPVSVPVLGVACGSVGALTSVAMPDLADALDRFSAGDWQADHLPALAVTPHTGEATMAINDFVVVRGGGSQVSTTIEVDGVLYGRVSGDGVVAATQLGSSAYSMAAGGPVLAPRAGWLVNPLAPHGGCVPPVVLGRESRARLTVAAGYAGARVEIDGRPSDLVPGVFDITLHQDYATLVRLGGEEDHFTGLRRRKILIDSPRVLARDVRTGAP